MTTRERIAVRLSPITCETCSRIAEFREEHPELVAIEPGLVLFASGDYNAKTAFRTRHPHS